MTFGQNLYGQMGFGDYTPRLTPTLIPNINEITQVSAGYQHILLLTNNSQVYVSGDNYNGELGMNDTINQRLTITLNPYLNNIIQVCAGKSYSVVITTTSQIYVFGINNYGQLGLNDTLNRILPTLNPYLFGITQVSLGSQSAYALTNTSQVYSFGFNSVSLKLLILVWSTWFK